MISLRFAAAALLLAAGPAYAAGTCEDNFGTKGDPRNGAEYFTSATVKNLTVAGALGQLRAIATTDGFKVLNEESTDSTGAMTLEQPASWTRRALLIYITATSKDGATDVAIQTRLPRGMKASTDSMRTEMCGMLGRIKPGAEGETAGATARKTLAPPAEAIEIAPIKLAREVDRMVRRDTTEMINQRYKGKTYFLDGRITQGSKETTGFWIWFDVVNEGNLLVPGDTVGASFTRTRVICIMAPDDVDKVSGLTTQDFATLVGTFKEFTGGTGGYFYLSDCRVAEPKAKK